MNEVKGSKIKILILGVGGMLGNTLYRYLSSNPSFDVTGTVRSKQVPIKIAECKNGNIIANVDVNSRVKVRTVIQVVQPDFVINCIGIIKQLEEAKDYLISVKINSLLPHLLNEACVEYNCKLIHFSTDCVFSGCSGNYKETDRPDASDLYGRSKLLGEVSTGTSALTLRTSIIGHELYRTKSLLNWFLSQEEVVKGYTRAIFSGLPTLEVGKVIAKVIACEKSLSGVYHLSSEPISKFDLLSLINEVYDMKIEIQRDPSVIIDRSLNSDRFRNEIGYVPPEWPDLIRDMEKFQ